MTISQFDISILDWLNSHHPPGTVPFLQFISNAATYFSISMVLCVVTLAVMQNSKLLYHKAVMLGLALILSAVMIQVMKAAFDRERPFITYPRIEKLSSGGGSSFPSGHSMEAFAMAMATTLLFRKRRLIIPVYIWAVMVAYSRLALGVHYPMDVLAGIASGTLIGWFVPWLYNKMFLS